MAWIAPFLGGPAAGDGCQCHWQWPNGPSQAPTQSQWQLPHHDALSRELGKGRPQGRLNVDAH